MPVNATLVSGPIGPDTLDLPGDPARLRAAVQQLRDLVREIEQTAQQLQQADPPAGGRGRTVVAISRGAQRTGTELEADARQLDELADAVDAAADALAQGHDGITDLRQRWRQARQELRSALQGAKNGTADPGPIMRRIDDNAAEPHEAQFRNQAGLTFTGGGGGGGQAEAMLVEQGGPVQQAIGEYRRAARGIVEEFSGLMQRSKNADRAIDERLPRRPNAHLVAANPAGAGSEEAQEVSAPAAVQSLGDELQTAAQSLRRATDRLDDIRLAIREGRMLPDDERIGSSNGFQHDWSEHFESIRESLNAGRRAADTAADRLRQIDEDGAADVRQALRGH